MTGKVLYSIPARISIDAIFEWSYSQLDDLQQIAFLYELMFRAIILQAGVTIITALAAGLFAGTQGAVSATLGGAACILPNLLFALRLKFVAGRHGASYSANFFVGEFVKIAATVGLLVLVVTKYTDLHAPSMLIGLGLALQAGFLAFWKKS